MLSESKIKKRFSNYQGRKKSETSNMLILKDSRGTPLACSDLFEGNHNDSFNFIPMNRDSFHCS